MTKSNAEMVALVNERITSNGRRENTGARVNEVWREQLAREAQPLGLATLDGGGRVAQETLHWSAAIPHPSGDVEAGTYPLVFDLIGGEKIVRTVAQAGVGTCTVTFSLGTTPLGSTPLGGNPNSVSTSRQAQEHSSANVASEGDTLWITIDDVLACEDLRIAIHGEWNSA